MYTTDSGPLMTVVLFGSQKVAYTLPVQFNSSGIVLPQGSVPNVAAGQTFEALSSFQGASDKQKEVSVKVPFLVSSTHKGSFGVGFNSLTVSVANILRKSSKTPKNTVYIYKNNMYFGEDVAEKRPDEQRLVPGDTKVLMVVKNNAQNETKFTSSKYKFTVDALVPYLGVPDYTIFESIVKGFTYDREIGRYVGDCVVDNQDYYEFQPLDYAMYRYHLQSRLYNKKNGKKITKGSKGFGLIKGGKEQCVLNVQYTPDQVVFGAPVISVVGSVFDYSNNRFSTWNL